MSRLTAKALAQVQSREAFEQYKDMLMEDIEKEKDLRRIFAEVEQRGMERGKTQTEESKTSNKWNNKLSARNEKFLRYCYNLDLENAKRYNEKVKETEMEILDFFMEEGESDKMLFGIFEQGKRYCPDKNEGALISFADDCKDKNESRQRWIDMCEMFKNIYK